MYGMCEDSGRTAALGALHIDSPGLTLRSRLED